jgi:uncharacterized protein involved in outer membrane biogenesis
MRLPNLKKLAFWSIGLFVLLIAAGYLAVPPIVKSIAIKQAGKALGREVSIDRIAFNPFALSATIEGLRIYEAGAKAPAKPGAGAAATNQAGALPNDVFVSIARAYVNIESSSIWNLAPVIAAVQVSEPRVRIVRLSEMRFNFSDIIETLAKQPKSEKTAHFSVNNIELSGGRIDIDDRVEDAQHAVTDIKLGVPFVSNLPTKVRVKVTPAFAAKFNESQIDLQGETVPFEDTLESSINISLDDLQVGRYLRYAPMDLGFELPSGLLSTDLRAYFIRAKGQPQRLTLSGTVKLTALKVIASSDKSTLIALPALEVDLESIDVFARRVEVSKVLIDGLAVDVVRDKDGRLNLLALAPRKSNAASTPAEPAAGAAATTGTTGTTSAGTKAAARSRPVPAPVPAAKPAPAPPWQVTVTDIALAGGRVSFTDRVPAQPFRTEANGITVAVNSLSTAGDTPARVTAALRTSLGETLSAEAAVVPAPFAAEGKVALAGLRPRNYASYYAPHVRFEIDEARVEANTGFKVARNGEALDAVLSGLALSIADLRVRRSGEKDPLINVKTLSAKGVDIDLPRRSASVGEFITRDGLIRVEREKDGSINLASLGPAPATVSATAPAAAAATGPATATAAAPAAPAAPTAPAPVPAEAGAAAPPAAWSWALKRAEVERWAVRFNDRQPAEPVTIDVTGIAASIAELTSAKGSRAKAALRLAINRTGTLSAKGQFGLAPAFAAMDVDARSLEVLPLQPYFTERLNILITSGEVSARGTVTADASAQPLRASYVGDANVSNFAALERSSNEELLRWKSLSIGGISASAGPTQLAISEIVLSEFFSRLILSQKGRLNLQDIVRQDAPPAQPQPAPPAPARAVTAEAAKAGAKPGTAAGVPFPVKIGRIALSAGNINFTDNFVKPNYRVNLTGMTGFVSTLTTDPGSVADMELRGQLDQTAPVEIVGRLNPLVNPLFLDIKGAIRGAELSTLSPYSTKYTGYGIERGRLTLTTSYRIEGRKLAAEHRIFLDQLTFNTERIEGPSVIKLPILFAVRLLQNRRGEIDLNLPISGTLDDPKFRLGPIIWQVVVNLITRAVTAPFALLGALAGGSGGADQSFIEFRPGSAALTDEAQKRLAGLEKALADRPALRLELTGSVDPEADRDALRRSHVDTAVRAQKARDLARRGETAPAIDEIKLDPKEYETFLRLAYREAKFPRPRNAIGILRELPVPEMEALMLADAQVGDDELRQLATARARSVEAFLIRNKEIGPERVFQVAPKSVGGEVKDMVPRMRVDMAIR